MGERNQGGATEPKHSVSFMGDPRDGTLVGRVGAVFYMFISGPSGERPIRAQVEGLRQIAASTDRVAMAVILGPNAGFPSKPQRERLVEAFRPWAKRGAPVIYHVAGSAFRVAVMRGIFASMTLIRKGVPGSLELSVCHKDADFARLVDRKTGTPRAEVLDVMRWARSTLRKADPSYL